MQNEHDDDLQPSVDQHGDVETEAFPTTDEELERAADDEGDDDELDDSAIVGK